jgi:hypothetical protein
MGRFLSNLSLVCAAFLGLLAGWILANGVNETRLERIIAIKWGDGKYGPAFYGAHVYLEPAGGGYSVRACVYIGRGAQYFHDCGVLGTAKSDAEAVARWGAIDWRADGLRIGTGADEYFLPRAELENHR